MSSSYFHQLCVGLESNLQTLINLDWHGKLIIAMVLCHHFQNLRALRRCWWRWKIHRRQADKTPISFCCFWRWPNSFADNWLCKQVMEGMTTGESWFHVLPGSRRFHHCFFAWHLKNHTSRNLGGSFWPTARGEGHVRCKTHWEDLGGWTFFLRWSWVIS